MISVISLRELALRQVFGRADLLQQYSLPEYASALTAAKDWLAEHRKRLDSIEVLSGTDEEFDAMSIQDVAQIYHNVIRRASCPLEGLSTVPFDLIIEGIKDKFFVYFFNSLKEQAELGHLPSFSKELSEKAKAMRAWMAENQKILSTVKIFHFEHNRSSLLPIEINLLDGLEVLSLDGSPISSLPAGFNLPALKKLCLASTRIVALPEGFNPPALEDLNLSGTGITALPEGFNPPALQRLDLCFTGITALPEGFNPPSLRFLYVCGTPITTFPEGFNTQSLRPPLSAAKACCAIL